MLYVRAVEKILNERDLKRSQYAQAKRVCEEALQEVRSALENQQVSTNDNGTISNSNSSRDRDLDKKDGNHEDPKESSTGLLQNQTNSLNIDCEKFFIPFELACQGDFPNVTVAALDGLQKLIAYGHITGNYPNPASPNKQLVDRIVETICSCCSGAETELQIIKVLLTLVTSQYVQIHEGTVLLVLRTCFNIYLSTKNTVNQITARAMLTQMLHAIFSRMETVLEDQNVCSVENNKNNNIEETTKLLEGSTIPLKDWEWESISWYKDLDLQPPSDNLKLSRFPALKEDLEADRRSEKLSENRDTEVEYENERDTLNVKVCSDSGVGVLQNETVIQTPEMNIAAESLPDPINNLQVNPFLEDNNNLIQDQELSQNENTVSTNFIHILQKDAFLTFWALCKLAIKQTNMDESNGDASIIKSIEVKAKILSFQLLKSILENCGPVFKTSQIFSTAIKQYLCSAMVQATISPILEVFQLNLDLLASLLENFRNVLKPELEVLCQQLLFPVFEPSNDLPTEYKILALGVVNKLFCNRNCLIDIFINYDSQVSLPDSKIFEKMVNYVCKTASENHGSDQSNPSAGKLRILAIESLVTLLKQFSNGIPKTDYGSQNSENSSSSTVYTEETAMNSEDFVSGLIQLIQVVSGPMKDVTQIDLIFQKFAQRMFESNDLSDERLESADAVYSLIYSSITLIGELSTRHQGKGKMSKEQFLKLSHGICNSQTLSDEYLIKTYEAIEAYLHNERRNNRKRQSFEENNVENVANNAKRLMVRMGLPHYSIYAEKQVRCIRRMFKIMGKFVFASLLQSLNEYDDTKISDVCLTGIQSGIHIASVLNLKIERDAFVQALSQFSLASLKEIKSRNVNATIVTSQTFSTTTTENGVTKTIVTTTTETKCRNVDIIQTLLNVAVNEGNCLGNSWLDTLKCISQLEAAQLMGDYGSKNTSRSNSPSPNLNQQNETVNQKSWYAWAGSFVPSFWDSSNKLDMASVKESMGTLVQKIFMESTRLDGNGIVDFLKALCQVSLIEITHPENPRSFVYEKIFEVAQVNIDRPCLQWCAMWQVLADYFSHLACSSDEDVSFFAIDSISRLVIHLLEKETLENFLFQNYFLQVFETILRNSQFSSTRGYLLDSMTKIIKSHASGMRSGWRLVFKILETNVYLGSENDALISFATIKSILDMFESGEVNLVNSFEEVIRCLKDFSFKAPLEIIKNESIKLLMKLAEIIHEKPQLLVDPNDTKKDRIWIKGWSPLFNQLSYVVLYAEIDDFDDIMQANSLSLVFELIKMHGDSFHKVWWKSLFDILFRIFNRLKFYEENIVLQPENPYPSSVSKGNYSQFYSYYFCKFAITDTFIRYYTSMGDILLNEMLEQLNWCITQNNEQIALSGVQCFNQIIRMLEEQFTQNEWNIISILVQKFLYSCFLIPEHLEIQEQSLITSNSVVQLELLKLVKNVLFVLPKEEKSLDELEEYEKDPLSPVCSSSLFLLVRVRNSFSGEQLFTFLNMLEKVQQKVQSQNASCKSVKPPPLMPHETLGLDLLMRLIFHMYEDRSWFKNDYETLEARVIQSMSTFLDQFILISNQEYRDSLTEIMEFCLKRIINLPSNKFKMFTSIFYPNLCDMLELKVKHTLNQTLCKYFLTIGRSIDVFRMDYNKAAVLSRDLINSNESSNWNSDKKSNFEISFPAPEPFKSSG